MKKVEVFLKEFVTKLSDDQLKLLYSRLTQRLFGDTSECLELMSTYPDVDYWLQSAKSADELYEMLDEVLIFVEHEFEKRFRL